MTASVATHTQAIIDHLRAADIPTGDGAKPAGGGWAGPPGQSAFTPYCIVWRIGASDAVNLSLDDASGAEARTSVFIRCFGGTRVEAETLVDQVRVAMLSQTLTVPGRRLVNVRQDNGQTTTRSETTEVGLFEAGDFYRVRTVPA